MSNPTNQYSPEWQRKIDLFRRRFRCRNDVFATRYEYLRTETDHTTGEIKQVTVANFSPQCANYFVPQLCYIKEGKGGCTDCPNKKHATLEDSWISKHIRGDKDIVLYLLQEKGINFGACDFDRGNPFEEAKLCRDYSVNVLNLPCYIARSSKKGYHLYWFFSECVTAHLFTSVTRKIFKEVGIHSRAQNNPDYMVPEVFPKQTLYSDVKIGNCIKPPMIEPKIKEGFNCWVSDDSTPLPIEEQWSYFEKQEEITPEKLQKVIDDHQIEIIEQPHTRSAWKGDKKKLVYGRANSDDGVERKRTGDFWKIVKHCPAMNQFWAKDDAGNYTFDQKSNEHGIPNDARVAAMSFALNTQNGEEALLTDAVNHRKGWDESQTRYQLEHGKQTGYTPVTCRWLQEHGICKINVHPKLHRDPKKTDSDKDHCLKPLAPIMLIGGARYTNPDQLPENEWPEPSPSRYATYVEIATSASIIAQLDQLFAFKTKTKNAEGKLVEGTAPVDISERFHSILCQKRRMKVEEQRVVESHIKANNYVGVRDLNKAEKQAAQEVAREKLEEVKQASPFFAENGETFLNENGRYIKRWTDHKGNPQIKSLTNFSAYVTEELIQYQRFDKGSERTLEGRHYNYKVIGPAPENQVQCFKLPTGDVTSSPKKLIAKIAEHIGIAAWFAEKEEHNILHCINQFSRQTAVIKSKSRDIGHLIVNDRHHYFMPSVIVTKDGVKPNTEIEVNFEDEFCKGLDFKFIDESDFKDLAQHIVRDYFRCNTPLATMTAFAHAMSAAMISHMPLQKSPILWLHGDFENGKSFVAEAAQAFFGNFTATMNTGGSGNAKVQVADSFRHATLLVDDFKQSLSHWGTEDFLRFIQSAYDRSGRAAMERTGELRKNLPRVRGNIIVTGEDVPTKEASALSRMITVDIDKDKKNVEFGERVRDRRKDYCGFTPYFINYVYSLPESAIKSIYREYLAHYAIPIQTAAAMEGSQRIAENLASNMTAFRLAMDMLIARGVLAPEQKEMLCNEHIRNLDILRLSICNYVRNQKGSTVFLDALRDCIQMPAKYHIFGWPNGVDMSEHRNSTMVGFWRPSEPDEIKVMCTASMAAAGELLSKNKGSLQGAQHIARQLASDGHIPEGRFDGERGAFAKQITSPYNNQRVRVWVIKCESLGLEPPTPHGFDVRQQQLKVGT